MPTKKLTKAFVAKAACPPGRSKIVYSDTSTRGLTLEVRESGGRTYYFRYHDAHGRQRNVKIGNGSAVTLDTARQVVLNMHNELALGRDPAEIKQRTKQIPLLETFVRERYLPYVKGYKRSWRSDESLLRHHILPAWGRRRMDSITLGDVTALHHSLKAKGYAPGTSNRVLVMVRYIYNLALKWGIDGVTENPSNGVDLFKVNNEQQLFLSRDDVRNLFEALKTSPNPQLYNIVGFLLLTGARKREALSAEWRDMDFENRVWVIPETKSGRARKVPLSDMALRLLDVLPSRGRSPYLFPSQKTGKPFCSVFYSWNSARKRAGLPQFRMHDLRHSFASFLVNSGRSLYEVQKLLGHSHIKTTERYAHLSNETLAHAVNAASGFVTSMALEPGAVPMALPPAVPPAFGVRADRGLHQGDDDEDGDNDVHGTLQAAAALA